MQFAKGIRSDRCGVFFLLLLVASCAAASSKNYNEILTSANRPDTEKALDAVRKPQEVMAFYEVKTGQRVADIFASRGYYTAILSQLVGADGVVYYLCWKRGEKAFEAWHHVDSGFAGRQPL